MANNSESVFALPGSNLENFNERATANTPLGWIVCTTFVVTISPSVEFQSFFISQGFPEPEPVKANGLHTFVFVIFPVLEPTGQRRKDELL